MAKRLAAALALLSGAAAAAAGKKPHLIYVIGDDVGWYKMVRCSRLRLSRSALARGLTKLVRRVGTTRTPGPRTWTGW